jgi:hypothetical protein
VAASPTEISDSVNALKERELADAAWTVHIKNHYLDTRMHVRLSILSCLHEPQWYFDAPRRRGSSQSSGFVGPFFLFD